MTTWTCNTCHREYTTKRVPRTRTCPACWLAQRGLEPFVASGGQIDVRPAGHRAGLRCADCGAAGERTGHMTCQYPGRFSSEW